MRLGTSKELKTGQQRGGLLHAARHVEWGDAVGVSSAAALAASLTVVTLSVVRNGPTAQLDLFVDTRLPRPEEGPPAFHSFAVLVTTVAQPFTALSAMATLVFGWSAYTRSRWPLSAAIPALIAVVGTVLIVKRLVGRAGPPYSEGVFAVGGPGFFPSGHTATALVCAGTLAVLLGRVRPQLRGFARLAAGAWTLLVDGSMVSLHHHWFTDVVGAILLGTLVLWLLYRWPFSLAGE